jgi:hypothetical protein
MVPSKSLRDGKMKKILASVMGFILLSACGPKLYYPSLDWLIPWYVDDYISLKPDQSSRLRTQLVRQLDWHCRTQLPEYAEFLRDLHREIGHSDRPVTVERLDAYKMRLIRYWNVLIQQVSPDIADIMFSATDEQIDELFENLEKKNRDIENEYVRPPPQKIIQNRQKRMQKRLNYWIGDLTEFQLQAVNAWSLQIEPIAADRVAYRRKIQAAGRRILKNRTNPDELEAALRGLFTNAEEFRTENYQRKIDINTHRTLELLAYLLENLTPNQRNHLLNRLESLATDLDQLSCDPASKKTGSRKYIRFEKMVYNAAASENPCRRARFANICDKPAPSEKIEPMSRFLSAV